jgi:hypothetical protein
VEQLESPCQTSTDCETTGADSTLPYEEDEDDVEEEDWLSSSSMTSLTRDLGLKLGARLRDLLQLPWIEGSLLST